MINEAISISANLSTNPAAVAAPVAGEGGAGGGLLRDAPSRGGSGLPKCLGFTKNRQPEPWLCSPQGKPFARVPLLLRSHLPSGAPLSHWQPELFPAIPLEPPGSYLRQKSPFWGHSTHPILALSSLHRCDLTAGPRSRGWSCLAARTRSISPHPECSGAAPHPCPGLCRSLRCCYGFFSVAS